MLTDAEIGIQKKDPWYRRDDVISQVYSVMCGYLSLVRNYTRTSTEFPT